FVALQSFSQSLSDEKGVGGLLQAPDLAVSDCPEMGESGLHPPPLLRNAEIMPENDHVIARLEVGRASIQCSADVGTIRWIENPEPASNACHCSRDRSCPPKSTSMCRSTSFPRSASAPRANTDSKSSRRPLGGIARRQHSRMRAACISSQSW